MLPEQSDIKGEIEENVSQDSLGFNFNVGDCKTEVEVKNNDELLKKNETSPVCIFLPNFTNINQYD